MEYGDVITSAPQREDDHARWYGQLLSSTRDAVICIDGERCIVLFNRAAEQVFGYEAAEVMGRNVNLLMAEPYASEHDGYVDHYEATGERHAIGRIRSVAARRKSGEVFPIELSVTEVDVGQHVRYGAFIRDVSEKVRLQERLLERERLAAIGTTAASFAHEIGNPLNGMYMHAQLLERRLAASEGEVDPRVGASLDSLLSETRRLRRLLDEFRALARRNRISPVPADLVAVVADVLESERPTLNARGIHIQSRCPPRLRTGFVDSEKIRQVLLNLIKNAADAMPDGGTLVVRVLDRGPRIRVEVQDQGEGVPPELDPFEPFVTSKPDGTGLGLAVAMQIVQAHGGTLGYEAAEGGGTIFALELPRRDSSGPEAEAEPERP